MADENIHINVNLNNQIKAAEQKKVQQKQSDKKISDKNTIIPQVNFQSSKFIQELSKSKLFQNINSSLSDVSNNIQTLKQTSESISQMKLILTNIQKVLQNKNSDTNSYKQLPQIFANNSFFKDLFTNLDNINTILKLNSLNKTSQTDITNKDNTANLVSQLDPFFNNINTNLQSFLNKFDSLIGIIQNINLDNIITTDNLTNILMDYKLSIQDETIQKISVSIKDVQDNNNSLISNVLQMLNLIDQKIQNNQQLSVLTNINTNILQLNDLISKYNTEQKTELIESKQNNSEQQKILNSNIIEAINLNIHQQKQQQDKQLNNAVSNANISVFLNSNIKTNQKNNISLNQITKNENLKQNSIGSEQKQQKQSQYQNQKSSFNISDDLIDTVRDMLNNYQQVNNINLYTTSNLKINNKQQKQLNNKQQNNNQQNNIGLNNIQENTQAETKETNQNNLNSQQSIQEISNIFDYNMLQKDTLLSKQNSTIQTDNQLKNNDLIYEKNIDTLFQSINKKYNDMLYTQPNLQYNIQEIENKNQNDNSQQKLQKINLLINLDIKDNLQKELINNNFQQDVSNSNSIDNNSYLQKPLTKIQQSNVQTSTNKIEETSKSKVQINKQQAQLQKVQSQKVQIQKVQTPIQQKQNLNQPVNFNIQTPKKQETKIQIDNKNLPDIRNSFQCKILTDKAEKTKLQELLNSSNIDDIKTAIKIIQQQINRLSNLMNDKTYSQYFQRISIYITLLQQLLIISQKKLKTANEISNIQTANNSLKILQEKNKQLTLSQQINNVPTQISSGVLQILDIPVQQDNSQNTIEISETNKKEQKQTIDTSNVSQNLVLPEQIKSKQQELSISKFIDNIKFDDQNISLYGKQYVQNILTIQDKHSKQQTKQSLSPEKINLIGNNALLQFKQALNKKKILVTDVQSQKKIFYNIDDLKSKQQTLQSINVSVKKVAQPAAVNKVVQEQVKFDNTSSNISLEQKNTKQISNPPPLKLSQKVQKAASETLNANMKRVELQSISRQADDDDNKLTDFDYSPDTYDFNPKTKSTQYNDYVLNKKYNYIINKHIAEQQTHKIDEDFDKKSSQLWNQQYKKGILLSINQVQPQDSSNGRLFEQTTQRVSTVKDKYNALSFSERVDYEAQNYANDVMKTLQKFLDDFDQTNTNKEISNQLEKSQSNPTEALPGQQRKQLPEMPQQTEVLIGSQQSPANLQTAPLISQSKNTAIKKQQAMPAAISQSSSNISNTITNTTKTLTYQQRTDENSRNIPSITNTQQSAPVNLESIQNTLQQLGIIMKKSAIQTVYVPAAQDGVKPVLFKNFGK